MSKFTQWCNKHSCAAVEPVFRTTAAATHQCGKSSPTPIPVLVCLEQPIADGEAALPEEIEHVHLAVAGIPLQGFEDRGGGQPLVHEQRQGRHVEGEPLGLPGPVEGRGEGGVVAPGGRRLLLAELRLRAGLGPEQGARLGVRVAPGAPLLAGPVRVLLRRLLPAGHRCFFRAGLRVEGRGRQGLAARKSRAFNGCVRECRRGRRASCSGW